MKWGSVRIAIGIGILLVGYQNCGGPVHFEEMAEQASLSAEPSLPPSAPLTCLFDGKTLNEGDSIISYLSSTAAFGESCVSESRVCKGGSLSGSYSYAFCNVDIPKACIFNGKTIAHGAVIDAYQNSAVDFGGRCVSEVRVCDNGSLSGSFAYAACEVGQPKSCLFDGKTLAHGSSVIAFLSSSVAFGKTCVEESRKCLDGSLSGTFEYTSCSVGAAKSCVFNGRTVAHGESVSAYSASSVAFGGSCAVQDRICHDGVLSGSFEFASCAVEAPVACLFQGQTIAHGQSVVAYKAVSAPVCEEETRVCSNGTLSGTFQEKACEVPCTDMAEKTRYLNTMIQIFENVDNVEIATNCIDVSNQTLEKNLPKDAYSTLRFKNTCGNRYCRMVKNMDSGRIIDMKNGQSTLECRYEKTPQTYVGTCEKEVEKIGTPMSIIDDTPTNVRNICGIDSLGLAGIDYNLHYMYTCGYKYCVSKGFADGRMVELNNTITTAHCYRDFAGSLPSLRVQQTEIAAACTETSAPTVDSNMPNDALSKERFMSTCGNRYCISKGYSMGHVVELYSDKTALLKCLAK